MLWDKRMRTLVSLTEADIRLFTTLIRFDTVYVGHFKCNIRRIADYPNLSAYTRDIYQWPGIAATVNFEHIRRHYYESHRSINPSGIVPLGPPLDFTAPHGREHLAAPATFTFAASAVIPERDLIVPQPSTNASRWRVP
jgi:glutathionyl-hydroquinone reductase